MNDECINREVDKAMKQAKKMITANILRGTARYTLIVLGILVFVFALFSGAEGYGGGFQGVIKNSPNALPWLLLLILVLVAWKWELAGGLIITLLGLFLLYFFNFRGPNFWWSTFILTLIIPLLGCFFIMSWYLRKGKNHHAANIGFVGHTVKQTISFSLLTAFASIFLIFLIAYLFNLVGLSEERSSDLAYLITGIAIAAVCFYLCRKNPKAFLNAPIICNAMGIIAAVIEPNFWKSAMWIMFGCGWVLSGVAAVMGSIMGGRSNRIA